MCLVQLHSLLCFFLSFALGTLLILGVGFLVVGLWWWVIRPLTKRWRLAPDEVIMLLGFGAVILIFATLMGHAILGSLGIC